MAEFQPAFENTLKYEDSIPSGEVTPEPKGGRARFGINSIAHPNMPDNFWTDPADQAIKLAEQEELVGYWQPNMLGGILSQDVATKLFDMSISMGRKEAIILAQRAVIELGQSLTVDGLMGPHTLSAINAVAPSDLLNELRLLSVAYYHATEQQNPADLAYDKSWMQRARA